MTHRTSRMALMGATMLMGTGATPALAQETPQISLAEPASNNEIVVTGSRRATTLQDAPINISAVGADTLSKQRVDDVRALANFTPGITVVDTGPSSTGNIILRGISSSDTSVNGSNQNNSSGVYLGEVPL